MAAVIGILLLGAVIGAQVGVATYNSLSVSVSPSQGGARLNLSGRF